MLSIAKINAASNQSASGGKGYLHYLGEPSRRQRTDFDDYARREGAEGPPPFWACRGAALLGLDDIAEAEHVERLARGFHPVTGESLVKGAGDRHVMGLDMTFSAPKDFSAVFAGADQATRDGLLEALRLAAKTALDYAEDAALTRHGHAGRVKQKAEAAVAACYTHFASRALDPQLHVHAFMFNVGKREGVEEWSALEHRPQFERKMATGILFRVELAHRLRAMGFDIEASGPYFAIRGITEEQREALSTRSKQIAEHMQRAGFDAGGDAAGREIAALNSRAVKSEPPLRELLELFEFQAAQLGITPASVLSMRAGEVAAPEPVEIDRAAILAELMESQSCATSQEALCLICEKAMGRLSAAECLAELGRFLAFDQVVHLGRSELLTQVFTSKATLELETAISRRVAQGAADRAHRLAPSAIEAKFAALERELSAKLGVPVSLAQQRDAALHVGSRTGRHAFVEGWAGTGKTTMLRALGQAYKESGFAVLGCCQSAAASQNLARETGIPSRTIASLLLSLREGRAKLTAKSVVVLDEAGMVGSSEFAALQEEAAKTGAKLVCVGDPKQLQPIGAGGIFASLMREHGKAEISAIQRQRTDFAPLLAWLESRATKRDGGLTMAQAQALRLVPEEARMQAMEAVCAKDAKLAKAFARWRSRFDHQWMREVVEQFAKGEAKDALRSLDARGRLQFASGLEPAMEALVDAWERDRTALPSKAIVAGTRGEVARLNELARSRLVAAGIVQDGLGAEIEIVDRDENRETKSFAPGDRVVFTQNERPLGVVNGAVGTVKRIAREGFELLLSVELDDENERGEREVQIPASFGRFDLAYCLTNHKALGRTFDAAYILANPAMTDRQWTYVAASRSRFATTMFVNALALGLVDPESHQASGPKKRRADAIEALARRMTRSRAKGTTLDHAPETPGEQARHAKAVSAMRALFDRFTRRANKEPEMTR
ncbi:MobF family relaxase [Ramlibacter sp.]|uniref:MobF family relaxase n=1 Tax=Ramlibacter sp. TaxID=1917967 RepID=UPI003D0FCE5B